jgi:lysophospholipase L1-like esterase
LSYELVPDMQKFSHGAKVQTNSYGMRDREPLEGVGESLRRIAVLGDSFTFGFGVPERVVYPTVLERRLSQKQSGLPYRVDVLNFGVGGYSTRDEAIALEHRVVPWKPSVVIIGYVLNDPETRPIQPLHSYFQEPEWWQHSHVLRLIAGAKNDLDIRLLGGGDYLRYLHSDEDAWSSVEDAFETMGKIAKREGFEIALVIFPMLDDPWDEYPYRDLHAQVARAAEGRGFHVLDVYDVYSEHDPAELRVSEENGHPNQFGHSLAAEAIRAKLLEDPSRFFPESAGVSSAATPSSSDGNPSPPSR